MKLRFSFAICPVPYVDLDDPVPRFPTFEAAEAAARDRTARTGEQVNVIECRGGGRVVLAVTRRDAECRVWTDAESQGTLLV
jgi:hypothetical protein